MSAKEILKLIETVNPTDTAKLDEIDARVWHHIASNDPKIMQIVGLDILLKELNTFSPRPKYTRSRDALKAIRPHYWCYEIQEISGGRFRALLWKNRVATIEGKYLPTETLAELHVIIQAIEFERSNDK